MVRHKRMMAFELKEDVAARIWFQFFEMAMEARHTPLVSRTWRWGSFSYLARKFPAKSTIWTLVGKGRSRKCLEFN
ncbi:hypothetical protein H5410_032931 [Solanum commersonii]|uniref:Uncharacterized protein n=1 Tax=Solanum commersonii TaxID=4109 RepID=A0A9J5YMD5_SOLCO|nr:hypothetical protein H5410_032931 [Solanum commersonii]